VTQNCSTNHSATTRWRLLCGSGACAILAVSAAIRIIGIFNDLWLDEIWSLDLIQRISSPLEVFTGIHHDNNHYLNSLCLFFLGNHGNWPGYRVPSALMGIFTVALAWLIGLRRNLTSAFFAMILVGFSYLLVLYSTEARGYAAVVFFSFLSFYALDFHLAKPRWQTACLVGFCETMGFLAHLSFLFFFCAALAWSAWRFMQSNQGFKRALILMTACHAPPVLVLGLLYFIDIRLTVVGGGTQSSMAKVYADALAWSLGSPAGIPQPILVLAAVALFGAGLWILWRARPDLTVFFVGVMISPILVIVINQFGFIYVRHFLISVAFLLILISFVLARLYQQSRAGKGICLLFLTAYLLVNGWHIRTLFRDGWGHYGEAARFMAGQSKGSVIRIGSDHDFRNPFVLQFYGPTSFGNKKMEYFNGNSWPQNGVEWVVCHKESFEAPVPSMTQFTDGHGNQYELMRIYPAAPLSGLPWFIYHNKAY